MTILFGKRILIVAVIGLQITSCASVAPILTGAAIKFGQDLLSVATHNVSPQYSADIEQLLVALLSEQTGLKIPLGQDAQYGYSGGFQDQYGYGGNNQNQNSYGGGSQDQYGYGGSNQDQNSYGGGSQDQYGYGGSNQDQNSYGGGSQDQYGYGGSNQNSYGGGSQDQYGYGGSNQDQNSYGGGSQDQYGYGGSNQDQNSYRVGAQAPISMDVGLLAQKIQSDGSVTLEAIQDGAVLHDGRGNPAAGDKIKITFKTNCTCYVYIIGIDATGFVAQIFPDPDSRVGNPVSANRQYMFPEGDIWWGLDEYRGIETVYFVASHQKRADIEDVIVKLASKERRLPNNYQTVQVAAVIPQTRGLVKVQAAPITAVPMESGSKYEVTPTAFTSAISGVDLVVTRWFSHQ